jgi:DNA-binding FrmR family transcriptional regulator
MRTDLKREMLLGLKVASGHLDAVRRMVDDERYCVDIMKQLSAVQANLRRVQELLLRNHLTTCVADAVRRGFGEEAVDELLAAFKFEPEAVARLADAPPGPCRLGEESSVEDRGQGAG